MNFLDVFDFARVAGSIGLLFFLVPWISRRAGSGATKRGRLDVAPAFIYASAFFEVSAIILGNWRLCYAGSLGILALGWVAATVAFASRRRWIWDPAAWRGGFLGAIEWLERGALRRVAERYRSKGAIVELTGTALLLGGLLAIAFLNRASFALENARFLGPQTYERALSLQTLVHGGSWARDGSVALLAPVVHFSGVDGATAVRFSGPVFALLLVLAGGFCAWIYMRRLSAALVACVALAIYPAILGFDSPGEPAGPELSTLYWVLAIAMLRTSWRYALAAAAVAYLIHDQFSPVLAGTILCMSAAVLASAVARGAPRFVTAPALAAGIALGAAALPGPAELPAPNGPFQYESAARAANRIARDFPRNKWMIVSPAPELSSTYGRGWHLQISDFIRAHSPAELARPEFRFDYTVDDMFVFVEKEPLRQNARTAAMAADDYSYRYFTQIGRTTLEFQAAQLMEAYVSSHAAASVYAEDDRLVVYRIVLAPL